MAKIVDFFVINKENVKKAGSRVVRLRIFRKKVRFTIIIRAPAFFYVANPVRVKNPDRVVRGKRRRAAPGSASLRLFARRRANPEGMPNLGIPSGASPPRRRAKEPSPPHPWRGSSVSGYQPTPLARSKIHASAGSAHRRIFAGLHPWRLRNWECKNNPIILNGKRSLVLRRKSGLHLSVFFDDICKKVYI
jgi:hypothetical protein